MRDMLKRLDELRKDAADCELIRNLATHPNKRELFDRLAKDMTTLADQVETAIAANAPETRELFSKDRQTYHARADHSVANLGRPSEREAHSVIVAFFCIMEPDKRAEILTLAERYAKESQVVPGITHYLLLNREL